MTDKQIVQFILHRAAQNGQKFKLNNPKLIIYRNCQSLFLAVRFDGFKDPFMVRFVDGSRRGIFKINPYCKEFEEWKTTVIKDYDDIDYDIDSLPACVKRFVSCAFIKALKNKGMGFDLFSISFHVDPLLVSPNESYEEAAIETDLMDFDFDLNLKLTSPIDL